MVNRSCLHRVFLLLGLTSVAQGQRASSDLPAADVAHLISAIQTKAKTLESSTGMHAAFESFAAAHKLPQSNLNYTDFVMVRLLFEATRDAGFWNMHWNITNLPPNSDNIWRQWKVVQSPSYRAPTASAECDEFSALFAFLALRAGVHGVGLFWPAANHTVAVWVLHPASGPVLRVVVPTTQIFLDVTDSFDTRKFNPWRQKSIFEYTRRDVADAFQLPRPLLDFFLLQVAKYAGASDSTLQQLRYLREGVFLKYWTPEQAAQDALRRRGDLHSAPTEDLAAFQNFAQDMRSQ